MVVFAMYPGTIPMNIQFVTKVLWFKSAALYHILADVLCTFKFSSEMN